MQLPCRLVTSLNPQDDRLPCPDIRGALAGEHGTFHIECCRHLLHATNTVLKFLPLLDVDQMSASWDAFENVHRAFHDAKLPCFFNEVFRWVQNANDDCMQVGSRCSAHEH